MKRDARRFAPNLCTGYLFNVATFAVADFTVFRAHFNLAIGPIVDLPDERGVILQEGH